MKLFQLDGIMIVQILAHVVYAIDHASALTSLGLHIVAALMAPVRRKIQPRKAFAPTQGKKIRKLDCCPARISSCSTRQRPMSPDCPIRNKSADTSDSSLSYSPDEAYMSGGKYSSKPAASISHSVMRKFEAATRLCTKSVQAGQS